MAKKFLEKNTKVLITSLHFGLILKKLGSVPQNYFLALWTYGSPSVLL